MIFEPESCIFVTDAKPIASIDDPNPVRGLAALDNKLYVLRKRPEKDQVYVYDTKDHKLQHNITVPGLHPDMYNNLTECAKENCLFLSEFGEKCIRKIEPKGAESKVSKFIDVPYEPKGLSITPEGNLLVAGNPNKLAEYNVKTGEKVCEVELQFDYPLHAVKRTDGQYVVSHTDDKLSRVCRVGKDGHFRHCFGGMKGAGDDQLNYACHLALVDNFYVIVADNDNNRVILLNGWLDYVHTLVENFTEPHRLWFNSDPQSRLLYVGESKDNGSIKVYQTM